MPFLIPSVVNKIDSFKRWKPILWEELKILRADFEKRVENLKRTNKIDHVSDLRGIELDTKFLYNLVMEATEGHYLVAQYYCDPVSNKRKNLNVFLCVKKKKSENDDDDVIVNGVVFDTYGNIVEETHFSDMTKNYRDRRAQIRASSNREFDYDREGRAHVIDDDLRKVVKLLYDDNKSIYLYFILDNELHDQKTLSVVFADQKVDFSAMTFTDPIAYDHGTACCPLQ